MNDRMAMQLRVQFVLNEVKDRMCHTVRLRPFKWAMLPDTRRNRELYCEFVR